ncbi:YihY/virulence factor BrkB family protein [Gordonia caeni]|uniref:Inner membrane protein YhjD n=1 Tax=Gordonia caeni TaxID=1007097 RepID=A0ABP7P7Z5_9ACTN
MTSNAEKIKQLPARAKALYEDLTVRWRWLARALATLQRYGDRRGSTYAAAIAFSGVLALVPILMVSFAVAGFVLAGRPELVAQIIDEVVKAMPGQLGETVGDIIESAIDSRGAVGTIGLVSAALTGIGWITLVRTGMTDMWGGRMTTSAVMGKLRDLGMFVTLGLVFVLTIALSVLANGPVASQLTEWVGLEAFSTVLRWAAQLVAVAGTWGLFLVVLAKLPRQKLPFRTVLWTALGTALVFTVLKELGGLYLRSVLSGPAGVAFGPIIGILAFSYLASQIVLYATAWISANPANEQYRLVDYTVEETEPEPVLLAPVYEESAAPRARALVTAAGVGAAAAGLYGWIRRDR